MHATLCKIATASGSLSTVRPCPPIGSRRCFLCRTLLCPHRPSRRAFLCRGFSTVRRRRHVRSRRCVLRRALLCCSFRPSLHAFDVDVMRRGQTCKTFRYNAKQIDPLKRFQAFFQADRALVFRGVLIPRHDSFIETSLFCWHHRVVNDLSRVVNGG